MKITSANDNGKSVEQSETSLPVPDEPANNPPSPTPVTPPSNNPSDSDDKDDKEKKKSILGNIGSSILRGVASHVIGGSLKALGSSGKFLDTPEQPNDQTKIKKVAAEKDEKLQKKSDATRLDKVFSRLEKSMTSMSRSLNEISKDVKAIRSDLGKVQKQSVVKYANETKKNLAPATVTPPITQTTPQQPVQPKDDLEELKALAKRYGLDPNNEKVAASLRAAAQPNEQVTQPVAQPSFYHEGNRELKKEDEGTVVKKFDEEALKQLEKIFKQDAQAHESGGLGGVLAGEGLLGFGKKLFGKGKGAAKGAAQAEEGLAEGVKSETQKVYRNAKGQFVKAEQAVAETAKPVAKAVTQTAVKSEGMLGKLAKTAGKVLPKAARGLGAAAIPIAAGLEAKDRYDKGQNAKQIAVGTGLSTAGGIAGGIAGAEGGAALGGSIGALFGGVGAVPGAAIGGVVGGIGGAIAGSGVGGWIADKFTGVIKPKENAPVPQTRDLSALNKKVESKKAAEKQSDPAPTIINAPTTTTNVTQTNRSMVQTGGSPQGYRGSLDLKKFVT